MQIGTNPQEWSDYLEVQPLGILGRFLAAGRFFVTALLVCLGTSMFWDSVMTSIMSVKMPIH